MKSLILTLALATVFLISGCATNGEPEYTQEQYVAMTCVTVSGAMEVVTAGIRAGKVEADVQNRVLQAAERLEPICTADTPPNLSDLAFMDFQANAGTIAAARASLERSPD